VQGVVGTVQEENSFVARPWRMLFAELCETGGTSWGVYQAREGNVAFPASLRFCCPSDPHVSLLAGSGPNVAPNSVCPCLPSNSLQRSRSHHAAVCNAQYQRLPPNARA
jgi:hypothetical protein